MKKKEHKKSAAQIKYESMSRAERRVAIAKDVIAAIHAKKFRRIASGYAYVSGHTGVLDQAEAKANMARCIVCARGAMMLTRIAKYNGVSVSAFDTGFGAIHTVEALKDAFTPSMLEAIENAFEAFPGDEDPRPEVQFGADHDVDEDRLLAIMQNLVDHSGAFRPEVRYEVQ